MSIHIGTDRAALERIVGIDHGDDVRGKPSIVIVGQGALRGRTARRCSPPPCARRGDELGPPGAAHRRVARGRDGRGRGDRGRASPPRSTGADVIYNLGADEIEIPRALSSSTRAATATGARTGPT
jgi:NADH-quinone oxidoreductase subunit G